MTTLHPVLMRLIRAERVIPARKTDRECQYPTRYAALRTHRKARNGRGPMPVERFSDRPIVYVHRARFAHSRAGLRTAQCLGGHCRRHQNDPRWPEWLARALLRRLARLRGLYGVQILRFD